MIERGAPVAVVGAGTMGAGIAQVAAVAGHPVLLFDAAGLGLFVAAGADKALAFHANPVAAILFGTLTGIGGGMVRDVLVGEIPAVLRTDIYALAALIGAAQPENV